MAGAPATIELGACDRAAAVEHHRQLDFVLLVHLDIAIFWRHPFETEVDFFAVVRCLENHWYPAHLAGWRLRFEGDFRTADLLAGDDLVANFVGVSFVALGAGAFLVDDVGHGRVIRLVHDPFQAGLTGIEHLDLAFGNLAPVRRCGKRNAGDTHSHDSDSNFFHESTPVLSVFQK